MCCLMMKERRKDKMKSIKDLSTQHEQHTQEAKSDDKWSSNDICKVTINLWLVIIIK